MCFIQIHPAVKMLLAAKSRIGNVLNKVVPELKNEINLWKFFRYVTYHGIVTPHNSFQGTLINIKTALLFYWLAEYLLCWIYFRKYKDIPFTISEHCLSHRYWKPLPMENRVNAMVSISLIMQGFGASVMVFTSFSLNILFSAPEWLIQVDKFRAYSMWCKISTSKLETHLIPADPWNCYQFHGFILNNPFSNTQCLYFMPYVLSIPSRLITSHCYHADLIFQVCQ